MQSSSLCALLLRLSHWLWDKMCSTSSSLSEKESPACWLHKGEERKVFPFDAITPYTTEHQFSCNFIAKQISRRGRETSHTFLYTKTAAVWLVAETFDPFDWLTKLVGRCPVGLTAHMTDNMAVLVPALLCFCTERNSVHVHCPCQECLGKPVNYKTQERHLSALRLLEQENSKFIFTVECLQMPLQTEPSIDPLEQLARPGHKNIGIGLQFETCLYILLITEVKNTDFLINITTSKVKTVLFKV